MVAPFQKLKAAYGVIRAIRNAGCLTFALGAMVAAEPVTIAALGDSLTQGFGLPLEQGFVPQLGQWLDEQGADVRLINSGVSGDTTAGGLSRIAWTLSDDIDALIVTLGGNDMLRGIDPSVAKSNLDGLLRHVGAAGLPVLLIGMDAPPNFGPDYEAAFDAIYPDLAQAHGAQFHPNFLGALAALGDRAKVLRLYMQPDGIHPNADGVALIVDDIGPSVLELVERITQ